MREELIKKVIKDTLFIKYQINESFDRPFSNIIKKSDMEYDVDENGVKGVFYFTRKPNNNDLNNYYFYNDKIDVYYDVSWQFKSDMSNELKTPANWMKMTATAFKIIDDFIRTKHPLVIKFSFHTPDNWKIYSNSGFLDKLKTLFSEKFDVLLDNEFERIYLINKNASKFKLGPIEKLTEQGCMSFEDAWNLRKFPKKRNQKGILRNDTIKEQQKRILYKWKYLFN